MANGLFDCAGKVTVVTGGNGGIGFGFAMGVAKMGGDVAIWARNAEKSAKAKAELEAAGAGKVIAYQVDVANKQTRAKLLKRLMSMEPYAFEDLIRQLLLALGFEEVDVTSRSNDGGIDVRGTLVVGDVISTRLAVQVKRWKHNVQAPVVQQVRGSLGTHEQGLIITTSDFSKGARDEAVRVNATPVALMDGEKLVKLLVENEIGVTSSTLRLVQIDETDETASAKEEIHHGTEK